MSDQEPPRYGRRIEPSATASEDALSEETQDEASLASAERQWWDDPRLPWQGKPSAADKRCWGAFILLGVYGLVMIPLRWLILGQSIYAAVVITGSSIGLIDIGAGVKLGGEPLWWMWWIIAAVSMIKFDWIFWWAGRLWGKGFIEVMAGRSRWAARTAHHAERLAERYGGIAVFLSYLIPFLPSPIVFAFVGSARMRLRTFLVIDFLGSLTQRAIFVYLGYAIGESAKDIVDQITKYSTWITIALVVLIMARSMRSARQDPTPRAR